MLPGMYARRKGGAAAGGGVGQVTINTTYYSSYVNNPTDAYVGFTFQAAGLCNGVGGPTYTWLLSGAHTDYQCMITNVSGSTGGSTRGVWNPMNGSTATMSMTLPGEKFGSVGVKIKRVSDGYVLQNVLIDFYCYVDPESLPTGGEP